MDNDQCSIIRGGLVMFINISSILHTNTNTVYFFEDGGILNLTKFSGS